VNHPTPAIVAQGAVRRLPRLALWLLCLAYVLPGFLGREPWKSADLTAFGYMAELAHSTTTGLAAWLNPQLMGQPPEVDALLPYWIGAWAMQLAPSGIAPDLAARLPFAALLLLTLVATWYGVYHLARSPGAQPVAFAFGGEARPADYGRALADGGLLALLGCLGLAQLAHETTPALVQVCCTALLFYAVAALPAGQKRAWISAALGLAGLTLSGAPTLSVLLGAGAALLLGLDRPAPGDDDHPRHTRLHTFAGLLVLTLLAAALASGLHLWRWRMDIPEANWREWRGLGRLFLWFTWPVWPLVLWTLWRWRRQLGHWRSHRHLTLPLWFATVAATATLTTTSWDRALLLALPALATLAAFALPTLERSVAALIDWFTLLFFSGCAVVIWVVWLAMQTGVPHQPAANVARLAPGFEPSFSAVAFGVALLATLAWVWLVHWRTSRHRSAIWKSMILPAGGAALSWLLLMTLWLPLLDFARSYAPLVQQVARLTGHPACLQVQALDRGQIAAFQFHGAYTLELATSPVRCPWLLVASDTDIPAAPVNPAVWTFVTRAHRATSTSEIFLLFRRKDAVGH